MLNEPFHVSCIKPDGKIISIQRVNLKLHDVEMFSFNSLLESRIGFQKTTINVLKFRPSCLHKRQAV